MLAYISYTGCGIASRKSLKRRTITQEGFRSLSDLTQRWDTRRTSLEVLNV